ncbi:MAG: BolA family protein [Alphaproteobacteria bacterium]|jgi:BolA protein|nr:BolA family protein [Alphaproteobacteria bacterium]|tara:strand:- start:5 stop:286 length:282 start_codon:yes stop_codon:yes gene_type:complete
MSIARTIEDKLAARLATSRLVVIDESRHHAGHAGARAGGESHFRVEIVSREFAGLDRLARQRLIHDILAEELAGGVHALSLETVTPDEAGPDS